MHRPPTNKEFHLTDILGNYSLTQIDVLSTLPIVAPELFPAAVQRVVTFVNFNQDVKVQVFEVTIRVLGALISTFQTLEKLPEGEGPQVHKDKIMSLAKDLGSRLLPAFDTSTGIPYARVNLKHGVEKGESVETCKFHLYGYLSAVDLDRHRRCWQLNTGVRNPFSADGRRSLRGSLRI